MRLAVRVTVSALLSLALTQYFKFPLAGLWAVLTAVVVTQVSVSGSLKATVEYLVGTLGGAVYAGAIAALVPHSDEVALLAVLALAVAPLSLLAVVNPHFRVGPLTAVIVVLGTTVSHTDPVQSAFYRVIEVSLGGAIGLAVSFLVLPARAHNLAIDAAAGMLEVLARALPEVFAGLRRERDATQILQLQDSVGAAFARFYAISTDVKGEQIAWFGVEPDLQPLVQTLLRLRHDLVMIGRTAQVPLPDVLAVRLAAPIDRAVDATVDYLQAARAFLITRNEPPSCRAVNAALDACSAELAVARREGLIRTLPDDVVQRVFAFGFTLEQMRKNYTDLAACLDDLATPKRAASWLTPIQIA
jgi:hypothetical protein